MVRFTPPLGLGDESVRFIKEVVKRLNKEKVIQDVDTAALRLLVISYDTYLKASTLLVNEGPVIKNYRDEKIPHPAAAIASKNYNQFMRTMVELGLTPKSRDKTTTKKDEKPSPLDNFFKGRK